MYMHMFVIEDMRVKYIHNFAMNIIIATAHSKQSAAMLDVKFTSSSMDEKQYFAFLAACCRFWKSKFHLGHWIEVRETSFKSIVPQFYKSNHFPSFFH